MICARVCVGEDLWVDLGGEEGIRGEMGRRGGVRLVCGCA